MPDDQVWQGGEAPTQDDYLTTFIQQINDLYMKGFAEFVLQRCAQSIHPIASITDRTSTSV